MGGFLSEFLCREKRQIMLSMNVDKSFSILLFIITRLFRPYYRFVAVFYNYFRSMKHD